MTTLRPLLAVSVRALLTLRATIGLLGALAGTARAQNSWTETVDAGSTIATAQTTAGPGTLVKILGTLANVGDVDVYCVNVINPPAFSAQLQCAQMSDPSLFLFRATGLGLVMNDVCAGGSKTIPAGSVSSIGQYFLAVAPQGVMPQSIIGAIWQTALFTGPRAPDGPGAAGSLLTWGGAGTPTTNQPYLINLAGAGFCASAVSTVRPTWGTLKLHHR